MGEKLKVLKTANSLAITAGIFSLVCAILIFISPDTVSIFGAIFHGIDIDQISKTATIGDSLLGTLEIIVLGWLAGALFAWVYNKL